ncbi:MAG: spore germination protein [Bacillaceae bacterium]|nr:spore germination protein [Bacillaceae bacterium]
MNFRFFKKKKKQSPYTLSEPSPQKMKKTIIESKQQIIDLFVSCDDIKYEEIPFSHQKGQIKVLFVYSEGLSDTDQLNEIIIPNLEQSLRKLGNQPLNREYLEKSWVKSTLTRVHHADLTVDKVLDGELLLYFDDLKAAYTIDISKHPQRKPEEASTEAIIKGPRDNFVEELSVNIGLIRKRYRSNRLKCRQYTLGKRTKTKIAVMYDEDIIDLEIISKLDKKIKQIQVDGLISSNQLKEYLTDTRFPIFPEYDYTSRADYVADCILRGRFTILVDGTPIAILAPVNMYFLLKSPEDTEYFFLYNSFERILRWVGISIATFLPGFWIALVSFHQEQLPLTLIATLVTAREGVPLPSGLEALIMLTLFELFREAGLRLPMSIGQTLTVVGGLIIGDAAIRSGLTSPAMIVVIATSLVASFTLRNQSLIGTISVLRILVLIICSFFGLFGLFVSIVCILIYLSNLRPFGIPYLVPMSPFNFREFTNSFVRKPWSQIRKRPGFLDPQDPSRRGDNS